VTAVLTAQAAALKTTPGAPVKPVSGKVSSVSS